MNTTNLEISTIYRLEPQNDDYSIEESLMAKIKDPLWMLGRQWQMGEFTAENGGVPVNASVQHEDSPTTNIIFPLDNNRIQPIEQDLPLEYYIESAQSGIPPSWNSQTLSYQFSVKGAQFDLSSKEYLGNELDWYHFNISRFNGVGISKFHNYAISPITYAGMPHPRWWGYENGQVNLGQLSHPQINNLSMLVSEFSLFYGQDWYTVFLNYTLGDLRKIGSVIITDSFGIQTHSQVIQDNTNNSSGFEMFCLEKDASSGNVNSNQVFYLPCNAWHTQKSADIENVTFLRDEISNSIWAIENLVTDSNDNQVNRNSVEEIESFDPSNIENPNKLAVYCQQKLPPRHWIPYVQPLNQAAGQLRRARTYLYKTQFLGKIVSESKYIDQEQISRIGLEVSEYKQLVRKIDGSLVSWISRHRNVCPYKPQNPIHFDKVFNTKN